MEVNMILAWGIHAGTQGPFSSEPRLSDQIPGPSGRSEVHTDSPGLSRASLSEVWRESHELTPCKVRAHSKSSINVHNYGQNTGLRWTRRACWECAVSHGD